MPAYIALDRDNSVVGPDFPDPRGLAFLVSFRPDYLSLGTQTLPGDGCTDANGHCFDVEIKVTLVSTNVPPGLSPIGSAASAPTADTFRDEFITPLTQGDAPTRADTAGPPNSVSGLPPPTGHHGP